MTYLPIVNMSVPTRVATWLATGLLLGAALASPAGAQVVLTGRVVDDVSQTPLEGARVLLLNRYNKTAGYAVTGESGQFRFERSDYGIYRLDVKAPGFEPAVTPLLWMIQGRDFAELEVRLAPHAVLLAPLEVVELSPLGTSPVLENMMQRRLHGFGYQITRQDIEERHPQRVTDMLAELPGVRTSTSGNRVGGRTIHMDRVTTGPGGGDCPVQVFVDGTLAHRGDDDVAIDDLVDPLDVEAIEVFRGLATTPPEFLNSMSRCGVIAIWTRRGIP